MATDFADPRWMTYKQAQTQGWQVRGGERATQIQHWIWEEERVRVRMDGQPVLDGQKRPIKDLVRLECPKVIAAALFNAEQIDGIPALEPERTYDWDPVEQAEKLLRASGAKIEHSPTGGAYYNFLQDTIRLPSPERFATPNAYYATALHELSHWTAHPDRLNRDVRNPFVCRTARGEGPRSALGRSEKSLVRGTGSSSRKNREMGTETSTGADAESTGRIRRGDAWYRRGCRRRGDSNGIRS